jgi:hypothetical protein
MYYSNGDTYKGEWTNNQLNGKGVYDYVNGNKSEGQFINDEFNGKKCPPLIVSLSNKQTNFKNSKNKRKSL